MKFRVPLLAILAVVVVHVILMVANVYAMLPDIDNLLHFSGGFVMAMLAVAVHHDMTDKHDLKGHPLWYHFLFVIGFVMLIGVAWEFHSMFWITPPWFGGVGLKSARFGRHYA